MDVTRVIGIVVVASALSIGVGYALGRTALGRAGEGAAVEARREEDPDAWGDAEADPERGADEALRACEVRLSEAEEALARRPAAAAPAAIDVAAMPEQTRAALASPEASAAIASIVDAEVERRIAERFERERERRRAEWAARRAETRERLRAIGIDDETLARVTPAMCAMRDAFRQAWRDRREGGGAAGGDAGARSGRRAVREATRGMREEVESALGPDRMAQLEEEGGLRALGSAVECGDEDGLAGGRGGGGPR